MKLKHFLHDTLGKSKSVLMVVIAFSAVLTLLTAYTLVPLQTSVVAQAAKVPLDPLLIPKWVNQLTGPPPVYVESAPNQYSVNMSQQTQQVLPTGFPMTEVWGYGGPAKNAVTGASLGYVLNSPGPSFEVTKGTAITVNYTNLITTPQQFAVDPTLHWADPAEIGMPQETPFQFWPIPPTLPLVGYDNQGPPPTGNTQEFDGQSPVPLVPHLHGGEVPPTSDGGPDAWWTNSGVQGPGYSSAVPTSAASAVYYYPNINPASTLWYHDHALGITRLNVMSGLAGFYLVRDPTDPTETALGTAGIAGKYDMPLVFQDRSFFTDGSFNMPYLGVQPDVHPYWIPEFFGDTIMVNGLVWPNMDVDQGVYRFRLLDGSNARFYTIQFIVNPGTLTETVLPFTQIASDGGFLTAPVPLTKLTFAPGERAEILVDFSGLQGGDIVLVKNTAKENFPAGLRPNPKTVGQLLQFTVVGGSTPSGQTLPFTLAQLPAQLSQTLPVFPTLNPPRVTRILTLVEVLDPVTGVPLELLLDGQKWGIPGDPVYEQATVGDTEEWWVINPTADSHPIHLHLVQFQVMSRQKIDVAKYYPAWLAANGGTLPFTTKTVNLNPYDYLRSTEKGPDPGEMGWKDTVMMHPGELTKIRIRFAPVEAPVPAVPLTDADLPENLYPFDPTAPHGPSGAISYGYVWHCHIIDHEDNEMMRPLQPTNTVIPAVPPPVKPPTGKPPKK